MITLLVGMTPIAGDRAWVPVAGTLGKAHRSVLDKDFEHVKPEARQFACDRPASSVIHPGTGCPWVLRSVVEGHRHAA